MFIGEETAGKKLKRKNCGRKVEIENFSTISPHIRKTLTDKECFIYLLLLLLKGNSPSSLRNGSSVLGITCDVYSPSNAFLSSAKTFDIVILLLLSLSMNLLSYVEYYILAPYILWHVFKWFIHKNKWQKFYIFPYQTLWF
jgi:hypothetical protein